MNNLLAIIVFLVLGTWVASVLGKRYITTHVQYWGASEVDLGQCFSVHCQISVFDPFRWTRDGVPLDHRSHGVRFKEETNYFNQRNLTIEVDSARPNVVGDFRCVTFNRQFHRTRIKGSSTKRPSTNGNMLILGQPLHLECPIEDENETVQWYKNGREVNHSSRVILEERTLHIPEVLVSDAGEYVCWVGDTGAGQILDVNYGAWVELWSLSHTEIHEGGNITFLCRVHGHPPPRVIWFVGNVALSHLHHGQGLLVQNPLPGQNGDHMLHLTNAATTNEALYTCRAHNIFGHQETSIYLYVKENHIVTNVEATDRHLWVTLNKPFTLQCNSTHSEGKIIQWLRNDYPVASNNASGILVFESNHSLLVVEATEHDLGEYLCIIRRPGSIDSARIFVQARILNVTSSEGIEEGNLVILRPGHNLTLYCNSSHQWDLIWYKNGELVPLSSRLHSHGPLLLMMNASEEDAGHYMCTVRADHVQRLINESLTVAVSPSVVPFPASESPKEGFRYQIFCQVRTGVPAPVVSWYKDGVPVEELELLGVKDPGASRIRVGIQSVARSSLLVWEYLKMADRGFYTCVADNGVGQPSNSTIFLRVRGRWAALWPFLGICCEVVILAATIFFSSKVEAAQVI